MTIQGAFPREQLSDRESSNVLGQSIGWRMYSTIFDELNLMWIGMLNVA
jgi:hypothetical protein